MDYQGVVRLAIERTFINAVEEGAEEEDPGIYRTASDPTYSTGLTSASMRHYNLNIGPNTRRNSPPLPRPCDVGARDAEGRPVPGAEGRSAAERASHPLAAQLQRAGVAGGGDGSIMYNTAVCETSSTIQRFPYPADVCVPAPTMQRYPMDAVSPEVCMTAPTVQGYTMDAVSPVVCMTAPTVQGYPMDAVSPVATAIPAPECAAVLMPVPMAAIPPMAAGVLPVEPGAFGAATGPAPVVFPAVGPMGNYIAAPPIYPNLVPMAVSIPAAVTMPAAVAGDASVCQAMAPPLLAMTMPSVAAAMPVTMPSTVAMPMPSMAAAMPVTMPSAVAMPMPSAVAMPMPSAAAAMPVTMPNAVAVPMPSAAAMAVTMPSAAPMTADCNDWALASNPPASTMPSAAARTADGNDWSGDDRADRTLAKALPTAGAVADKPSPKRWPQARNSKAFKGKGPSLDEYMIFPPAAFQAVTEYGGQHRFHEETMNSGELSGDRRRFTKQRFEGRLSVITEDTVRTKGEWRYTVQFAEGPLSNADGVGFIFSRQLPSPKNIQRIFSIFVNSTGRICIRALSKVVRSDVGVKPISIGDWIQVSVDLDQQAAEFEVWPASGGKPSRAALKYGRAVEQLRISEPSLPQNSTSCGYFACVIKHEGVTVQLGS